MGVDPQGAAKQQRFQLNWKVLAFAAVFLPTTVALGFWQLSRAEEKRDLLAERQSRQSAAPVALSRLPAAEAETYLRVSARGRYDNDRNILLDNRIREGRPGYEVITPFRLSNGGWVLVNRGWLAGGLDRSELPEVPSVGGEVALTGYLYRSPGKPFRVGEERWRDQWPQVLQHLDFGALSRRLERDFPAVSLRLERGAPGALETGWPTVNVQPEKHVAYAVQWFALALALLALTVFANTDLGARLRRSSAE